MNFTQNQPTAETSKGLRLLQVTLLALIIVGIGLLATQRMWVPGLVTYLLEQEGSEVVTSPEDVIATSTPALDNNDITFTIDGQEVTLVDGASAVAVAPDSASSVVTQYFGNEVAIDLDLDGHKDKVFLVTSDGGGSGVFFYVVGALWTKDGFVGTEAVFLGDRIAPQVTELGKNNTVVVNYADRAPGESFAVSPSWGKSLVLKFDPASGQFGEVVQDFEGEASAEVMTLTMKEWEWVSADYVDGRVVIPKMEGVFTVTFAKDGTFSVATDCNRAGGSYTSTGDALTFGNMFSTKMYCEGAQEEVFTALLQDVVDYHFTVKGELILGLRSDSGTVTLR
jgi:heat shock protein HslJ